MHSEAKDILHRTSPGDAELFDSRGQLIEHMHCLNCGYDLYSLKNGEQCPECGTPVALSAQGDRLHFCRPDTLRIIGWLVRLNAFAIFIGPFALGVAILILRWWLVPPVLAFAWSLTVIMATHPWPTIEPVGRLRSRVRLSGIAVASVDCMACFVMMNGNSYRIGSMLCLVAVMVLFSLILYGHWLSRLAVRIPHPDLSLTLQQRPWIIALLSLPLLFLVSLQPGFLATSLVCLMFVPIWTAYVLGFAYECNVAGEAILVTARLAEENHLRYGALLNKEKRFYEPPAK